VGPISEALLHAAAVYKFPLYKLDLMEFNNLTEVLKTRRSLSDKGVTFIEGQNSEEFLSYRDLHLSALQALAYLQSCGVRPKDELVMQIEDNKLFLVIFWACILGGIIPAAVSVGRNEEHKRKPFNIWPLLRNPYLIGSKQTLAGLYAFADANGFGGTADCMKEKNIDAALLCSLEQEGLPIQAKEEDIAFLQFSSGSTGNPKGVILTHKNLLANLQAIAEASCYRSEESLLSWMPLTHDMGLIGFHLNPLYNGLNHFLMPTALFIRRPALWLDKASSHQVNVLCSPNFGFEYIRRHCSAPGHYDWDLSRIRLIYNGAEPISEHLCREFLDSMGQYGLKATAMTPVYGLAEASLAVTITALEEPVTALHLHRDKAGPLDSIVTGEPGGDPISFVNVGRPVSRCLLRITDQQDRPLEKGTIGHVQIKGDNVTAGYYNLPEETQRVLTADGWLRTGDAGVIKDDNLYITGRIKDIIFVNGQNYYSHDLERLAQEVEGIELNKIVIAGYFDEDAGYDKVLAFLFHRSPLPEFLPMATALKAHLSSRAGLLLDKVIPVADIPRTTSGKLQRFKLIRQFRNGDFDEPIREIDRLIDDSLQTAIPSDPAGSPGEQTLMDIWKKIFNRKTLGPDENFFEIGGNSLKAAELEFAVGKTLGLQLPPSLLYQRPTVRQLAASLADLHPSEFSAIPSAPPRAYYPVSSAQLHIYYSWQIDPSSVAYNIPLAFELTGDIDHATLETALHRVIGRHESLHMAFRMMDTPVFYPQEPIYPPLDSMECSEQELDSLLKELVRPFDLSTGHLFRYHLLRTNTGRQVFFLDFHHIIADGQSVYNFIRELKESYEGKILPPLRVQYKDFASWEPAFLASPGIGSQQQYWLDKLKGELPVLELPLDYPRPAIFPSKGEKLTGTISPELTTKLRQFAITHHCTQHSLLFTLYKLLLVKYTGQNDIVIGIPVSGRNHPDLEPLIGMFVNSLPLRSQVNEQDAFTAILKKEHRELTTALDHRDYPFSRLTSLIGTPRPQGRNLVFDTMFLFRHNVTPGNAGQGLTFSLHPFDPGIAKYDLSLEITDHGSTLGYGFEYAGDLFRHDSITRLATYFDRLVGQAMENPGYTPIQLSLLSPPEFRQVIREFNASDRDYPLHRTIHQLFEEQALTGPDVTAIEHGPDHLTYAELNARSARLARSLREKGAGPDKIVAILMQRSPELIIAILGVLRAGSCFLPIDTDLPTARIRFLLEDSRCPLVLSTRAIIEALGESIAGSDTAMIPFEDLCTDISPTTTSAFGQHLPVVNPGNLAYVIYTSGTTGNPKGVMIEHRSLLNYSVWAAEQYVRQEDLAFPLFTPLSFDLTITSIFTPLITGNRIIIYGDTGPYHPLEAVIRDNKAGVMKLTPSHLRLFAESGVPFTASQCKVKRLIVGGEKLGTHLASRIFERFEGRIEIYNEYGPTEATVGCMIHLFQPGTAEPSVPIGVPAANTRIYLLDTHLQPVPFGVNGELYIGGLPLARGYLHNESSTGRCFTPDPFIPGGKIYRTGDIARRLPSGLLEYIGRSDKQVKVNGYRIELSEIESRLAAYEGLSGALAVLKTNGNGQMKIYAYYKSPLPHEEPTLKQFLAQTLPHYMIPSRLIRIAHFPLTANGKTDLEALPDPVSESPAPSLPLNEIEELSLNIWKEVLDRQDLDTATNFFEAGGDSIKAIRISSRFLDHGISLAARDILTYHTISLISRHALQAASQQTYSQDLAQGEIPITPIVSWFLDLHLDNPAYFHQSVLLHLDKDTDAGILCKAFEKLLQHHDTLRVNLDPDKKILFYNPDHINKPFTIEEYLLPDSPDVSLESICTGIKDSFDLRSGPLLKALLLTTGSGERILLLAAHHLVTDGISWRILLEDLHTAYHALATGKPLKFAAKTASLKEWGKAWTAYADSAAARAGMAFWKLQEDARFTLPADFETANWTSEYLRREVSILQREKTALLLREAHRKHNADIPTMLLTALVNALREWTGLRQFVIELENHGRHLPGIDVSRTLGWFTTQYPVLLTWQEGPPSEQVKQIKQRLQTVPDHGLGYALYRRRKKAEAHREMPEIRFNYLGQFDKELNNDLFSWCSSPHGSDTGRANKMTARLELDSMIIAGELLLEVKYNSKAFDGSTITRFSRTFIRALDAVLDDIGLETAPRLTPSDFGIDLDQEQLDSLFR
jgi:amino acid adenylation domain-containing protein/non-ribosomal peptide synthase protein (TIGR01720 family)